MKALILGGARSGKSRHGEALILECSSSTPIYIATGWAGDGEMAERIAHHQASRGDEWLLVEEEVRLAATLRRVCEKYEHPAILVDCLTLWLSNCLHHKCWPEEREALLQFVSEFDERAHIALVSNEVGSGIVPLGELSRTFVDEAGWLNQDLAAICEHVELVVAGLPLKLK